MLSRKLLFLVFGCAAGALSLGAQTTTTSATRQLTFPPTGIGSTETARINVVNNASNSSSGTAASCTGSIAFLNASGATIGTATTFTVTAGQISSVSLPFASSGGTGNRTEVRGVIQFTVSSSTPCSLGSSLETFETSSGATHLYLTGAEGGGGFGPGGGGH